VPNSSSDKGLQMTIYGTADREYLRTHPFLKFSVSSEVEHLSGQLWVKFGECKSKCEHLKRAPLRDDTAKEIHKIYLAKGTLATAAIEGNTLTEEDVRKELDGELKLPPSKQYLQREIKNIVDLFGEIWSFAKENGRRTLTPEYLCEINGKILNGLDVDGHVTPGKTRDYSVVVGNVYRAVGAQDVEYLNSRFCDWLNSDFDPPESQQQQKTIFGIIKAIVAHLYIAWIHPFGDGNGRTARMLELQILLESGVPTPAVHLLSNHYNLTRTEYYRQLDKASTTGEIIGFIDYAVQGFLDGLKEQIEQVWNQQYDVIWEDYLRTYFLTQNSKPGHRQYGIVTFLSKIGQPVSAFELSSVFGEENKRTFRRDIRALLDEKLIVESEDGYIANKGLIKSFQPWCIE